MGNVIDVVEKSLVEHDEEEEPQHLTKYHTGKNLNHIMTK
jgi:hypothetical protein